MTEKVQETKVVREQDVKEEQRTDWESQNVTVCGTKKYQEIISSKGFLPFFKWDLNTQYRLCVLKIAADYNNPEEYVYDKLPSWVFIEDLLGITIAVDGICRGKYNLETDKTVIENITELIPKIEKEEILKSKLLTDNAAKKHASKLGLEYTIEELSEDKTKLLEVIKAMYDSLKIDFISQRTDLRITVADTYSYQHPKFKSGVLDKTQEKSAIDEQRNTIYKYSLLSELALTEQYKVGNPTVDITSEEGEKKLQKALNDNRICSRVRTSALIFTVSSKIIEDNETRSYVEMKQDEAYRQLGAWGVSNSRIGKFSESNVLGADKEFDYLPYLVKFSSTPGQKSGNEKMNQGRNATITAWANTQVHPDTYISEAEVFEYFKAAIREDSYNKLPGFSVLNIGEFISSVTEKLKEYETFIKMIPQESKIKIGTDFIDVVLADIKATNEAKSFVESLEEGKQSALDAIDGIDEQDEEIVKLLGEYEDGEYVDIG